VYHPQNLVLIISFGLSKKEVLYPTAGDFGDFGDVSRILFLFISKEGVQKVTPFPLFSDVGYEHKTTPDAANWSLGQQSPQQLQSSKPEMSRLDSPAVYTPTKTGKMTGFLIRSQKVW